MPGSGQQVWKQPLKRGVQNGATITAAAEALLYPDYTFAIGYWSKSGQFIEFELRGIYSTPGATPGTATFRIRWGGLAGAIIAQSAAAIPIVSKTNVGWRLAGRIIARAANVDSATGLSLMAQGEFESEALTNSMAALVQPTPGTVVSALDNTIAKALSFTYQPSVATASVTCTDYGLDESATP